jgi:hypothetical protein
MTTLLIDAPRDTSAVDSAEETRTGPEGTTLPSDGVHTAEEYRSLAERLSQSVMRAGVSVRWWRGRVTLTGATVEYAGRQLTREDGVRPQPIYILPAEWETRFRRLEDEIRRVIYRRRVQVYAYDLAAPPPVTAPGTVPGNAEDQLEEQRTLLSSDNIVPASAKDVIRSEISQIVRERWQPLVNEFVAAYPDILAAARTRYDAAIWTAVENQSPTQAALPGYFKVVFLPLPLGVRADDLTVEALQDGAGDYLVALRESMIRQMIGTLRDASENLVARIREKGVVKTGTLEAVTSALANFRSFAGAMDADSISSQLAEAERLLSSASPTEINRSSRHGVGDIATRINEVVEAVALSVAQAGEAPRRFQRRVGA